jgi:hypothetical protein
VCLRRARRRRTDRGPVASPLPGREAMSRSRPIAPGLRTDYGGGSGTGGVGPVSSLPQVAGESQAGHTCHLTNRLWQRGRA